ncbi:DHH family phosphoesterase [Methanosarcina sp. WH1]|uniref:DHH family phosphoesterase n=1 Tax=Methanosarcina sp. WH1 TaxID=1434102 RepID=UPI0006154E9A|nr:DHH family phosphoesterase [Methanosarcina sp. WH1]AKB23089.1 protein F12M16.25 [Methanosarcina sp. WH1]
MTDDKRTILIYHHDDNDGCCSAAVAGNCYGRNEFAIKFVAINYGKESWNEEEIGSAEKVWLLDFTSDNMNEFVKACGSKLIWIDHHKTAMEKYPDLWNSSDIPGIRSIEKAACVLTWEYTHPENISPPAAVAYIGDKDIWKFEYDETRAFAAGFSLMVKTPDDAVWDVLLSFSSECGDTVNKMVSVGELLLEAQNYKLQKAFERGVDCNFHNWKARLVNTTGNISELGEFIYKKPEYDIAIMWQAVENMVVFSLRSDSGNPDSPDCAKIAQQYGGGGHKNAAGFQKKNINFLHLLFA